MKTFRPIANCPITGTAEARVTIGVIDGETSPAKSREFVWDRADPEIHVAEDLIDSLDPDGFAALTRKYKIGEQCVWGPSTRHAELQTRLVRTRGGLVIHARECRHATNSVPWVWAEDQSAYSIAVAASVIGLKICKVCDPI